MPLQHFLGAVCDQWVAQTSLQPPPNHPFKLFFSLLVESYSAESYSACRLSALPVYYTADPIIPVALATSTVLLVVVLLACCEYTMLQRSEGEEAGCARNFTSPAYLATPSHDGQARSPSPTPDMFASPTTSEGQALLCILLFVTPPYSFPPCPPPHTLKYADT